MPDLRLEIVARIAVFDSGLGSLSIIKAIQQVSKAEIIYFADQKNYPYGTKSRAQLASIIKKSIKILRIRFSPDIIVMASNTPSLMLNISSKRIIGVKPPLIEAQRKSKTKRIGVLATSSAIKSRGLKKYIKEKKLVQTKKILGIDGTQLVDLVETGKIFSNKQFCRMIIRKNLRDTLTKNSIDVVTLSSTHLPFLKPLLQKEFPDVLFLDPSELVAEKVFDKIKNNQSRKNSLKIFTTGDPKRLERNIVKLKIRNKVNHLSI